MTLPAVLDSALVFTREYFQQDDICRFCWSKDASKALYYKTGDSFEETPLYCKVKNCLDIDLSSYCAQYYPRKICENCNNNIEKFTNFRNFCHYSNRKLNEILKIKEECDGKEENDVIKSEGECDNVDKIKVSHSFSTVKERSKPHTFQNNEDSSEDSDDNSGESLHINPASEPTTSFSHIYVEVPIKGEKIAVEMAPLDELADKSAQNENKVIEAQNNAKCNTVSLKENPDTTKSLNKCEKCNNWFPNKKLLLAHMKEDHSIFKLKNLPEISCFGCKKLFTDKSARWSHEVRTCPALRDGYKCSKCNKYLPSRVIYEKHIQSHEKNNTIDVPEELTFKCDKCNNQFPNKMQLLVHYKKDHTNTEEISCFGCKKIFMTKKGRWSHELKNCPALKYGYKCSECDKYLPSRGIYYKHMQSHRNKNPSEMSEELVFKCDICNKQFYNKMQIATHINKEHSVLKTKIVKTEYSCFGCNKKFAYKNARWSHEVRTCPELKNGYKCSKCDKYLPSRKIYETHMQSHYENKKLAEFSEEIVIFCNKCNEKFPNKMQLIAHIKKVHPCAARSDRKDCVCETCGRVYNSMSNLKVHIDCVHNRKNIFKCSQCDYQASYKQGLLYHMRTHTGERPFACEFCPYRSATNSNMRKHLRGHSKEQDKHLFECSACSKKFRLKQSLQEHIEIVHEKSARHLCPHCGKVYLRKKNLRQHLAKQHEVKVVATLQTPKFEATLQAPKLEATLQTPKFEVTLQTPKLEGNVSISVENNLE